MILWNIIVWPDVSGLSGVSLLQAPEKTKRFRTNAQNKEKPCAHTHVFRSNFLLLRERGFEVKGCRLSPHTPSPGMRPFTFGANGSNSHRGPVHEIGPKPISIHFDRKNGNTASFGRKHDLCGRILQESIEKRMMEPRKNFSFLPWAPKIHPSGIGQS